jgi:hypothetical protein
MAALQALKQSLGALVGAPQLAPVDIQGRVRGRYPDAAPLPSRPALDRLLEETSAPLTWTPSAAEGKGAYCLNAIGYAQTAGTTTQFSRYGTLLTASFEGDADVVQAAAVEDRLVRSLQQGGMLVLTVHPRIARRAEAELLHRFGQPGTQPAPLRRVNFDALLLAALRDQAKTAGVDWNVVLQADAADRGSRHWLNLQRLVQRTLPTLRAAMLQETAPILLVSAGLLARYNLMTLITEAAQLVGRPGQTPSAWLLLPTAQQGLPVIDGTAVPLVNPSASVALVQSWVENLHRASAGLNRVAAGHHVD